MSESEEVSGTRSKWDRIYEAATDVGDPARILTEFAHLLPVSGHALDLACGLGANALFLAQRGLHVSAWDASRVAITRLQAAADCQGVAVDSRLRDYERFPPEANSFDLLVVSNFLYRPILPDLRNSLRPGGLVIYTTHTVERPDFMGGPSNPDYLLQSGELLDMFCHFRIHAYREEGLLGDIRQGERGRASIVASQTAARKPSEV